MVCVIYSSQNIIWFGDCFNFAQYPFYEVCAPFLALIYIVVVSVRWVDSV
nr:MAG TPA: hypothetical protein [Caudoviricetes sp.]